MKLYFLTLVLYYVLNELAISSQAFTHKLKAKITYGNRNNSINDPSIVNPKNDYFYKMVYGKSFKEGNDGVVDFNSNLESEKNKLDIVYNRNYKIKLGDSPEINFKFNKKSLDFVSCQYAQGNLLIVELIDEKVNTKPVYARLSKSAFQLFTSKDETQFFKLIDVKMIERVFFYYLPTLMCFEVSVTKQTGNNDNVILCASDEEERNAWVDLIYQFKMCEVKQTQVDFSDNYFLLGNKMGLDGYFNDLNNLYKLSDQAQTDYLNQFKVKNMTGMYKLTQVLPPGDSPGNVYKLPSGQTLTFTRNEINKTAPNDFDPQNCWKKKEDGDDFMVGVGGTIIQKITTMTLKKRKFYDILLNREKKELAKQKKITEETHKKAKEIEIIEKKRKVNRTLKRNITNHTSPTVTGVKRNMTQEQIDSLLCLEKQLKNLEKREFEIKVREIREQIKEEKYKASHDSTCYLKKYEKKQKQNNLRGEANFNRCIAKELTGFQNTKYVNDLCMKMFGEDGSYICTGSLNFCNMCCGHYTRVFGASSRYECYRKCTDVINTVSEINLQ